MAKILKKISKDDENIAKWIASDFKFAKDLIKALGDLKKEINLGDKKGIIKLMKQAEIDIRQVGRSERRIYSFTERLEKHIDELLKMLPEQLKKKEAEIEEQIEVADRTLLKKGSRYIGSLRLKLDLINELLKKKDINKVSARIDDLIASINNLIKWIGGLSVIIKREGEFIEELKKAA